jgi:tetratricopeptide (TPR) repeat protein
MIDRRSWTSSSAVLGCFLFALLLSRPAGAQSAPDDGCLTDSVCQSHYNQAVKLFEAGRFEPALPEFQSAYKRRQMPWLLINIGRTLHRLGRPREALEFYDRYRQAEAKPDAETQERLDKYTSQARALADTTPVGATATPPPTDVSPPTASPAPAAATEQKPIYKKWWFWTAVGGGVAAVVIIGVAAGVASHKSVSLPDGVPVVGFTF